jgi:uncharacterized protein
MGLANILRRNSIKRRLHMMEDKDSNAKRYISSRYNVGYAEKGEVFLFNTRTCGFMNLPTTSLKDVQWLLKKGGAVEPTGNTSSRFRKSLEEGGFVVSEDVDELEILAFKSRLAECEMHSRCSIVVIPTLQCNMKCSYCFEKIKTEPKMSKRVQERLVEYVHDRLKGGSKSVELEWFGGEPLLCFDIIKDLSRKVIDLCKRYRAQYSASMVTNGTLLTRERAVELKKLKVATIQVTLDGPPEIHDKRRPYLSGKGTFDVILKNVENVHRLIDVSLRCNVDYENLGHAEALADILQKRGLAPHVRLYYSPVHKGAQCCSDTSKGCHALFSQKSFAEIELGLKEMIRSKGFRDLNSLRPSHRSCGATYLSDFVVDAEGDLYKCNETVGMKEERVGTLEDGFTFNKTYFKWVNFDPLKLTKCRSCKVLPMCMGWCPAKMSNDPTGESCFRIKYNLIDELKLMHRRSTNGMEVCNECQ